MKALSLTGAVLCFRLLAGSSPEPLAAELRRLAGQLDAGNRAPVLAELPPSWSVETAEGQRTISTAPLRKLLDKSPKDSAEAEAWLEYVAEHLERYANAPPAPPDARAKLDRILARREFGGVGPPSALERLRERIANWVRNLIRRIFTFIGADPATGTMVFWFLLAGVVGALGWLLVRMWMKDETRGLVPARMPVGSGRSSLDWVRAARGAGEHGDWRLGIQCAYWAGIAYLEETDVLPRDRAHTPREYLRLLRGPAGSTPARFEPPAAALTGSLERFWYGRSTAGANDLAGCLDWLEALGCKAR